MAQSRVILPDDVSNLGKSIEHQQLTTSGYHREGVVIGDKSVDAAVAVVTNAAPGASDYGVVARDPATVTLAAQTLDYDTGAGTATQAILGIALPASGGPVAGGTSSNPVRVDPVGTTTQPVSIAVPTTGGYTGYHFVAAGSGDAQSVKASAGHLYGVHVFNLRATPIHVKFHNTAGVPTPGAAVTLTISVQAGMSRDVPFPAGRVFATGIGVSIVTGIADADGTGVTAGDCVVDIDYK